MADQIVLVQALHHDDDAAGELVIEAADQGVVVPVVYSFAACVGESFVRLQGIVDDDGVGAASGEHFAY